MIEIVEAPIPTISDKQKDKESNDERLNPTKAVEPLPESERPRKDGPGGEYEGMPAMGYFMAGIFLTFFAINS